MSLKKRKPSAHQSHKSDVGPVRFATSTHRATTAEAALSADEEDDATEIFQQFIDEDKETGEWMVCVCVGGAGVG